MIDVYANSFADDLEPLDSTNVIASFSKCADKLEKIAKDYRKLVSFMKKKQIKVLDADGFPHCGSFTVDEIDIGRLKQAGFVVDVSNNEDTGHPTFYVDENLTEILKQRDEEKVSVMGDLSLSIRRVGENNFVLNLTMLDSEDIEQIHFDRAEGTFRFKCGGDCDAWHVENLPSVARSLRVVNGLINNLSASADVPELSVVFESISNDLSLLQHLLLIDYDVDGEGDVVEPNDDEDVD